VTSLPSSVHEVAALLDHTLLKAEATRSDVERICREALEFKFASVCVNSLFTRLVAEALRGSGVKTCVVTGFPLGANLSVAKLDETRNALSRGAQEIDMVISIGSLKAKDNEAVRGDIASLVAAVHDRGGLLKVIIETCLLNDEEKVRACRLAAEARADFVKTSTGFSTAGATVADVALMRKTVGAKMGVKASGGIRALEDLVKMVEAGASRIGTSHGVAIVQQAREKFDAGR